MKICLNKCHITFWSPEGLNIFINHLPLETKYNVELWNNFYITIPPRIFWSGRDGFNGARLQYLEYCRLYVTTPSINKIWFYETSFWGSKQGRVSGRARGHCLPPNVDLSKVNLPPSPKLCDWGNQILRPYPKKFGAGSIDLKIF